MKILVDRMPDKKEACLFYRREMYYDRVMKEYCGLNNKECSFKNKESIFGGECRCLKVNLMGW